LGQAYGELGSLPKAIRHYEAAIAAEHGLAPLAALEQLANLQARLAVRGLDPAPSPEDLAGRVAAIEAAIARLDQLLALAGPTVERHNLRGGAYKRLALIGRGKARRDALERMRACYAEALALAEQAGAPAAYPRLMAAAAEVLRHHATGGAIDGARSEELRRLAASERARAKPDDFWAGVAVGDALLLAAVADGTIRAEEEAEVARAYLDPWRCGGSRLKLSSVTEQLEFLAVVLAEGPKASEARRQAMVASLNRIRARVARPR
jgi:tetratricopeptide (TPR) repeat protein